MDTAAPVLLKVEQVAALLNVSRWFVYDHGADLGLVKIGGANRYRLDRIEEYIAKELDEPAPVPSLITQSAWRDARLDPGTGPFTPRSAL
jgi:hypothetical protein